MKTNKIVINTCYGGFGLSGAAVKRYYEIKYPEIPLWFYTYSWDSYEYTQVNPEDWKEQINTIVTKDYGKTVPSESSFKGPWESQEIVHLEWQVSRTDPVLVQVVEELGSERASGQYSELEVVEFTGDLYRICEYDGTEWLETPNTIEWNKVEEE